VVSAGNLLLRMCVVSWESGQGMNIAGNAAVTGRRKRSLLPLLVVLFLISYGLLVKLVWEQDRAIDSQSTLIHLLYKDSLHLSALRKAERQQSQANSRASISNSRGHSPSAKLPVIQVPPAKSESTQVAPEKVPSEKVSSEQVPSIQAPLTQAPLTQVPSGKNSAKTGRKSGKAQKPAPNRPPAELTDPSDLRRVPFVI
jgi:hypothetical protein